MRERRPRLERDSPGRGLDVEPAARGSGVATAVLRALEEAARDRGWHTLRLETGTAQPDAIRFYEREGYHRILLFGVYIGSTLSVCYERSLSPTRV